MVTMSAGNVNAANDRVLDNLRETLPRTQVAYRKLHRNLDITYWVITALYVVLFGVGVALLLVPVYGALAGDVGDTQSGISGGLGIADFAALFLFKPLERIHRLMGDMSQLTLALDAFDTDQNLRLLQMDVSNRPSIGAAADAISESARKTIKLVQDFFEATGT